MDTPEPPSADTRHPTPDTLSDRQRAFLAAYLGPARFNATRAAELAGYAEPGQAGWRLLKNVEIQAAVQARLDQAAMGADEVLARLAEHARGSIADFVTLDGAGEPVLDLRRAKELGLLHLVKSLKPTRHGIALELYDAQAALVTLGRHHGLWKEVVDVSGEVEIRDAREELQRRLDQLAARSGATDVPRESEPTGG